MEIDKQKKNYLKNPFVILSMILVVGIASYFYYQAGFSLEVNLNGEVVAYVKNNEVVEEALSLVENNVLETYGDDAYYEKEVITEKVRDHKDDEIEADLLNESVLQLIEIYKPATVIVIDKKDAVAVETNRVANEVLEHLKRPYQSTEDGKVLAVHFSQEVELVVKDVLVDNILTYDLALLPFINRNNESKTLKLANGDSVATITPLSNLSLDKPVVINLAKDIKSPKPGQESEDESNFIQLDVVSLLEEKELVTVKYETTKENDSSLYRGTSEVTQAGKDGEKEVTNQVTYINGVETKTEKIKEEVLTEPVTKKIAVGTKERPVVVIAQSANSSALGSQIAAEAARYVGVPYVYAGASPSGFDCSGLTKYVYARFGINLYHGASSQSSFGVPVAKANLQPGDLVFFEEQYGSRIGHVGIYVGGGQMVHAPMTGYNVKYDNINSGYFANKYVTARRIP